MNKPPIAPQAGRLRRLTDEEIDLWIAVAKSVTRRKGAALPGVRKSAPPPPRSLAPPEPRAKSARPAQRTPAAPGLQPLEKRLKKQLARGRSAIDQSIDLHGMTQSQAHQALRGFLALAQSRGDRLVLVVTGKGGPKASAGAPFRSDEPGVLRRTVPHWLNAPELRAIVLGFEEAGPAHGGAGALYVRLRRGATDRA